MSLTSTAYHEAAHAVVSYRVNGHVGGDLSIVLGVPTHALGSVSDAYSDSLNPEHMAAHVLSCYAGGHAQREIDPATGDDGCESDDDAAREALAAWGWLDREQEFRERSLALVRQHWTEIQAVAVELLRYQVLDDVEAELVADAVTGDAEADVEAYRARRPDLAEWRAARIALAATRSRM